MPEPRTPRTPRFIVEYQVAEPDLPYNTGIHMRPFQSYQAADEFYCAMSLRYAQVELLHRCRDGVYRERLGALTADRKFVRIEPVGDRRFARC